MDMRQDFSETGNSLNTPVLFLIFNRPEQTREVFEAIRKVRPRQLFVAADGPRQNKESDAENCRKAREVVTQNIDWPCELKTLFRDQNLGCGRAVSGAITWFFEHVEEGIILEDDTLPGPGFFRFCTELLEKYRTDDRVMTISGSCMPCKGCPEMKYSYFFSNWDYMWGWATWRRAWKHFDYEMKGYDYMVKHGFFGENYYPINIKYYLKYTYDLSFYENDRVTWWSYQWGFARKINSGLVVVPKRNMIRNIGFGAGATNTLDAERGDKLQFEEMEFPLKHPDFVMIDRVRDDQVFKENLQYPGSTFKSYVKEVIPLSVLQKLGVVRSKY